MLCVIIKNYLAFKIWAYSWAKIGIFLIHIALWTISGLYFCTNFAAVLKAVFRLHIALEHFLLWRYWHFARLFALILHPPTPNVSRLYMHFESTLRANCFFFGIVCTAINRIKSVMFHPSDLVRRNVNADCSIKLIIKWIEMILNEWTKQSAIRFPIIDAFVLWWQ